MNKKITKSEQHPNWKDGVIVTFEDGSKEVYPKVESISNLSSLKGLDLNGRTLQTISNFGFVTNLTVG